VVRRASEERELTSQDVLHRQQDARQASRGYERRGLRLDDPLARALQLGALASLMGELIGQVESFAKLMVVRELRCVA